MGLVFGSFRYEVVKKLKQSKSLTRNEMLIFTGNEHYDEVVTPNIKLRRAIQMLICYGYIKERYDYKANDYRYNITRKGLSALKAADEYEKAKKSKPVLNLAFRDW
jgi:hypothetical protein